MGTTPGMKVTLSAAMRARDVSRPRREDEAAAEQAQDRPAGGGGPARGAGGPARGRGGPARGGSTDGSPPAARAREDGGSRDARPSRKGDSGGRSRRKRR